MCEFCKRWSVKAQKDLWNALLYIDYKSTAPHNFTNKIVSHVEALGKLAEDHDAVTLVGQLGQQSVQNDHFAGSRNDLFGHFAVLGTRT